MDDSLVLARPAKERREAEQVRRQAKQVVVDVRTVAERIRRMSRLYQERLEGRRVNG